MRVTALAAAAAAAPRANRTQSASAPSIPTRGERDARSDRKALAVVCSVMSPACSAERVPQNVVHRTWSTERGPPNVYR